MRIDEYFAELCPNDPPDCVHEYVRRYNNQPGRLGCLYKAICDVLHKYGLVNQNSSRPVHLDLEDKLRYKNSNALPSGITTAIHKTYIVGDTPFQTLDEAIEYRNKLDDIHKHGYENAKKSLDYYIELSSGKNGNNTIRNRDLGYLLAGNWPYVQSTLKQAEYSSVDIEDLITFVLNFTHYEEYSGNHFFRRS